MNAAIQKGLKKLLARRPGRATERASRFMTLLFKHLKKGQLPLVGRLSDATATATIDLVAETTHESIEGVWILPASRLSTEFGEVSWSDAFGTPFNVACHRCRTDEELDNLSGGYCDGYRARVRPEVEALLEPLRPFLLAAVETALDAQAESGLSHEVSRRAADCIWRVVADYVTSAIVTDAPETDALERLARTVIRRPIIGFTRDRNAVIVLIR